MPSTTLHRSADERFKYFTENTLPALLSRRRRVWPDTGQRNLGILVVVPSYLDLVRLRGYLRTHEHPHLTLTEYATTPEVTRTRGAFYHGRTSDADMLLMTERAWFYHRWFLRGVRYVVWYQLPRRMAFCREVALMQAQQQDDGETNGTVAAGSMEVAMEVLFMRWDRGRLERMVGRQRAKKMLPAGTTQTPSKDTFLFTSSAQ